MSTSGHHSSRSPLTSSNGTAAKALVPTNNVTTQEGLTVRARIDPTLTVDDVVKQLCVNLKIKEPPSHYALRDDTDELVTNDNLRKKIKNKINLKCVSHKLCTSTPMLTMPQTRQRSRSRSEGNSGET